MKAFLLVFLLFPLLAGLANPASAQVTTGTTRSWGPPNQSVSTSAGSTLDLRSLNMCLLADVQNIVSQSNASATDTAIGSTVFNCKTNAGSGCLGGHCDKSPYCNVSWRGTGSVMMNNLAYELTGQWNKIDWQDIQGADSGVRSKRPGPLDHDKCDVILSLGDMESVASGVEETAANDYIENYTYAQLTSVGYSYQSDVTDQFWAIVKASGIPYLPLQGNHDPWSTFKARMTKLNFANESWFYAKEPTYELSYAIKVPIWGGKFMCFISLAWADANTNDARRDTVRTWLTGTAIGCGGNHPTAIMTHNGVDNSGISNTNAGHASSAVANQILPTITGKPTDAVAYPGTAGNDEIFMVAAGHWINATSVKTSYNGLFGADADQTVYSYYSNWQQEQRHANASSPYGLTPADSGGAWYTVVNLQAGRSRICAHDWSPYFQTTNSSPAAGQASNVVTSANCLTFDFTTRFP